jgi:hypothetical protein
VGGLNTDIPPRQLGEIWVTGKYLFYTDYDGNNRMIEGINVGVNNNLSEGTIFVANEQLRWITEQNSPNYEMVLINPVKAIN